MKTGFIILGLLILIEIEALQLLANYKFWHSISDEIVLDYSGSNNHAQIFHSYYFTDRGYTSLNYAGPVLTTSYYTSLLTEQEAIISCWAMSSGGDIKIAIQDIGESRYLWVIYNLRLGTVYIKNKLETTGNLQNIATTYKDGWNLFTARYIQDNTITGWKVQSYLNLQHSNEVIYSSYNFKIDRLYFQTFFLSSSYKNMTYELWLHSGLVSILELSFLYSSGCSCGYGCTTSPSIICLPNHIPSMNYQGQICPDECKNASQSCDASSACIPKRKSSCYYGLYERSTSECLFFCPGNSCSCSPSNLPPGTNIRNLTCTCSTGFVQVSTYPLACISARCMNYNKVGYKYLCTSCETGYIVGCSGECCVCDTNYTQVSSNPVLCTLSILHCLTYINNGSNYVCSQCQIGYEVDLYGNCNQCSNNYEMVSISPYECALKIENCKGYVYSQEGWICEVCEEGYNKDIYNTCSECSIGYTSVLYNPLICAIEIRGCIIYSEVDSSWICNTCAIGYQVSCSGECCECDSASGYIEVSSGICIYNIPHCISYISLVLGWRCSDCELGYTIDTYGSCYQCMEGYFEALNDPLICLAKIPWCSLYSVNAEGYYCEECEAGYLVCGNDCCECSSGYFVSKDEPDKCIECPEKCKECKETQDGVACSSCEYGYIVVSYRCECDSEDFYLKDEICMPIPLEVEIDSGPNIITIEFNKYLSSSLTIDDFSLKLPSELNPSFLIYDLQPVQTNRIYKVNFSYLIDIKQSCDISIEFSTEVKDRQDQYIENNPVFTVLILNIEGNISISELCDPSCKECELQSGILICSTCHDYAFIQEGICKCFVEENESNFNSCPAKCPKDMVIDFNLKTCRLCDKCKDNTNQFDVSTNDNTTINNLEEVTTSTQFSSTVTVSALAIGTAFSADKVWSFMNTVQIFIYLPLLQVDMPGHLKEILRSQDSTRKYLKHAQDLLYGGRKPHTKAYEYGYESTLFIRNALKPLSILSALIILNILTVIIYKVSRGKIQHYSGKLMDVFRFKVYTRFYIQVYIDLLVPSLLQLIYVSTI